MKTNKHTNRNPGDDLDFMEKFEILGNMLIRFLPTH